MKEGLGENKDNLSVTKHVTGTIARASVVADGLSANAMTRKFGRVLVVHWEKLLKALYCRRYASSENVMIFVVVVSLEWGLKPFYRENLSKNSENIKIRLKKISKIHLPTSK